MGITSVKALRTGSQVRASFLHIRRLQQARKRRDSLLIPDFEAALAYSATKSDQLSFLQGGAWKDRGIKQFLEGQYRPGLGAFNKDK